MLEIIKTTSRTTSRTSSNLVRDQLWTRKERKREREFHLLLGNVHFTIFFFLLFSAIISTGHYHLSTTDTTTTVIFCHYSECYSCASTLTYIFSASISFYLTLPRYYYFHFYFYVLFLFLFNALHFDLILI